MTHHPLQLLQLFDLRSVEQRIERSCHFLHCGHLHEPEQRPTGRNASACVTLVSGSSFETRHTRNSYAIVTLDLLRAARSVMTIQYDPHNTTFTTNSEVEFPIDIRPSDACSVPALATAVTAFDSTLASWPNYLAALLLDQKAEVPVPTGESYLFASFDVLDTAPPSDLKTRATGFKAFRNALRVLYPRVRLARIFELHGAAVAAYGRALVELSDSHPTLKPRLDQLEADARGLAIADHQESEPHAIAMLREIASAGDFDLLREQAQRHLESPSERTAVQAKRALALAFANSSDRGEREHAANLYIEIVDGGTQVPADFTNLATLFVDLEVADRGQSVVLRGIATCRTAAEVALLSDVGHRIVGTTGDRDFRKRLDAAIAKRGHLD